MGRGERGGQRGHDKRMKGGNEERMQQRLEFLEVVQGGDEASYERGKKVGKEGRKGIGGEKRRRKGWSLVQMEKILILLATRKFGLGKCSFGRHPEQRKRMTNGRRRLRDMVGMEKRTREGSKNLREIRTGRKCGSQRIR